MSLKEWKKQYYPIPAEKAIQDDLTAARHGLRKWQGASAAALKRYRLIRRGSILYDHDFAYDFMFGSSTCALCTRCACNCDICPGTHANDGRACCDRLTTPSNTPPLTPYSVFVETGNVRPMLDWLRRTVRVCILDKRFHESASKPAARKPRHRRLSS